jgi:hypothetical protein
MKPPGVLSKKQAMTLGKSKGSILYKVFNDTDLHVAVCTGKIINDIIYTVDPADVCHLDMWFEKRENRVCMYLFDNYFHALAYSLKLKAEHEQKTKSEERTGVEGAA